MIIASQGRDTSWISTTKFCRVWTEKTKFLERISKMWRGCFTDNTNTNYLQINTIWAQNLANSTLSKRRHFQISMSWLLITTHIRNLIGVEIRLWSPMCSQLAVLSPQATQNRLWNSADLHNKWCSLQIKATKLLSQWKFKRSIFWVWVLIRRTKWPKTGTDMPCQGTIHATPVAALLKFFTAPCKDIQVIWIISKTKHQDIQMLAR